MRQFYDVITDFIFVEHQPEKADIIFVPGGPYPDSARYAAKLYKQGFAPYIMPSGKYSILNGKLELPDVYLMELAKGRIQYNGNGDHMIQVMNSEQQSHNDSENLQIKQTLLLLQEELRTESDYLCEVMRQSGVPQQALLGENQATYTYENAICSRKKLEDLGMKVEKAIICCQAFHARRSLLYYQEQFPEVEFLVCPVVTKGISRTSWYQFEEGIDTVLGEMERCGSQFHEIMRNYMIR